MTESDDIEMMWRTIDASGWRTGSELEKVARAAWERVLARLEAAEMPDVGDGPCGRCGGNNPAIWFATPNKHWNEVIGGPDATDDPGGLRCPNCFFAESHALGIRHIWAFIPDDETELAWQERWEHGRSVGREESATRLAELEAEVEACRVTIAVLEHPDHQRQLDEFMAIVSEKPCAICGSPEHAAEDGDHSDGYRYFIQRDGEPELEVTRDEWIRAERAAGFVRKGGGEGPATAGWSAGDISGRIEGFDPKDPV